MGIAILLCSFVVSVINIFLSNELFLRNTCITNNGVAFGIEINNIFFISTLLLIILIVIALNSGGNMKYILFSVFLLGLSNLVTRVIYGKVCDYITVLGISFNISDLFLVLLSIYAGVFLLFINRER